MSQNRERKEVRDMAELRRIEIVLPKHLADWLESFSKEIAMTPSQFLAIYYEVWRIGKDSSCVVRE